MTTKVERIHTIWYWCRDSYLRIAGRRLNLPGGTDPTKTYQWRYLEALDRRFVEWEFDDKLCVEFVDVAVRYATERKLLNKGLSIFLQNNLLGECYEQLRRQSRREEDVLSILRRTKTWLVRQAETGFDKNLVAALLAREGLGAYPNIVRWHQAGQLPDVYLALSRSCGIAIARLAREHAADRALLPGDARLFLTQSAALGNVRVKFDIRNALQDEWRRPCLS